MLGSMARFVSPEVLLKLMNCWKLFSITPPPASALSSATPFWLLASSSKEASPVAAAFRTTTPTVPSVGPTAICSSSGESTGLAAAARQAQKGQAGLGREDP